MTETTKAIPTPNTDARRYNRWITAVSIAVPLAVAILFGVKIPNVGPFHWLPPIYATINAATAVLLIVAVVAIRVGRRVLHERLMQVCMALSALFLVLYVAYHMTSDPTPYGGQGVWRWIYYTILVSHIVLSVAVIPVVLVAFARAMAGEFKGHRAIVQFAFPLWLYVTVSGVLVYWMISPYYT